MGPPYKCPAIQSQKGKPVRLDSRAARARAIPLVRLSLAPLSRNAATRAMCALTLQLMLGRRWVDENWLPAFPEFPTRVERACTIELHGRTQGAVRRRARRQVLTPLPRCRKGGRWSRRVFM